MMAIRKQNEDVILRRYLLGETSGEERSSIEQRLLVDSQYFNSLLKMEEQLIDEYAGGTLAGSEIKSFERLFLNDPERRKKIEFARTLQQYIERQAGAKPAGRFPSWLALHWRGALAASAAAVLVLLTISLALMIKAGRLQDQLNQAQTQRQKAEQDEQQHSARLEELARASERQQQALNNLEQEIARVQNPGTEVATLTLTPGLARSSGQAAMAQLSSRTRQMALKLELRQGDYNAYQAEVQTVEGNVVFSQRLLHPSGSPRAVTLQIPAALLTRSDYIVALTGTAAGGEAEKAGTYYFKVVRK